MYSLIQSETFRKNKAELPLAIGQTVENAPFILDLTEISHLLIAGATGQGKSVALHPAGRGVVGGKSLPVL